MRDQIGTIVRTQTNLNARDSETLIDLLCAYEDRIGNGEAILPEEICADRPDLLEPFRELLEELHGLKAVMETALAVRASVDAASTPPPAIPGYEILDQLGHGGMGVVYRARQTSLKRIVALKMIRSGAGAAPLEKVRFQIEAEAVARLQHPNIVQLYEFGEYHGQPFFTLEYVEGGSLAARIEDKKLPPREAASMVEQIAHGVAAAHARGIIHRDLKPENILLTADGNPKITDFGLAKQTEAGGSATMVEGGGSDSPGRKAGPSDITLSGAVMGTAKYMAPEQARGDRIFGPAADVWALGAILYRLLTGRVPFAGTKAYETLRSVIELNPTAPRRLVPNLSRDLETICLKCLHKEESRRYASAQQLANDLARFREGKPIEARPVGRTERTWKWAKRRPAFAAALLLSALAILSSIAGGLWFYQSIEDRRVAEEMTRLRDDALEKGREARQQRELAEDNEREANKQRELAEGNEREAGTQRKLAEANESEANKQRAIAEANEGQAKRERELAEKLQYAADINLAQRMFQTNRLFRMRELLLRYERADHLKNFEWDYLWQLCRTKLVLGPKHAKGARCVAFSPAGLVASGGRDGAIIVWDPASGKELRRRAAHSKAVNAILFSPDGKRIASAGGDRTVKIWDSADGRLLHTIDGAFVDLNGLAFSPDGTLLAAAGLRDTILICDAASGKKKETWTGHTDNVYGLAFSPDAKSLASASADQTVRIWNLASGALTRTIDLGRTIPYAVAYSPDGKWLAAGDSSSRTQVWDAADGKKIHEDHDHNLAISGVSFSPDGRRLLSVGGDGTARIRDVETFRLPDNKGILSRDRLGKPATVLYSSGVLHGGKFSPDGSRLVFCGEDGFVHLWDLTITDKAFSVSWSSKDVSIMMAQSPDARFLAHGGGENGEVSLRDANTGKTIRTFPGKSTDNHAIAFSPDGKWLVVGDAKIVHIWNVEDARELRAFTGHDKTVNRIAYDPRGRFVATGDVGGTIRLWNPQDATEVAFLDLHAPTSVIGLAFSYDGKWLVSAGTNKQMALWDAAAFKLVRKWDDFSQAPNSVVFAPDNARVATALTDGTVMIFDVSADEPVQTLRAHNGRAIGLAFTPDGKRLATGGHDSIIRIWDVRIGQPLIALHEVGAVTDLAFDPKGRRLASRSFAGVEVYFSSGLPFAEKVPRRLVNWYNDQSIEAVHAKHWSAQIFFCTRLLEADPEREDRYRVLRARAAMELKDWRLVIDDLTRAIELNRKSAAVWDARAEAFFSLRQYEKADADYSRAVAIDPKFASAWSQRGEARARLRRWTDAIADYTRALELNDAGSVRWRLRGEARAELGKWDDAIADFTQALERDPASRRILSCLVVAHLGLKDLPAYRRACISAFERLSHSKDSNDWNSLTWLCCLSANDAAKPDKLVSLMDKAVAMEPKAYPFANTRGAALYRAGRYEDAIRQLNEAIALHGQGGSFEDFVFLAMARFRIGKTKEAGEDWKRAIDLFDEGMKPTKPEARPLDWSLKVEWEILRQEADRLLHGEKGTP